MVTQMFIFLVSPTDILSLAVCPSVGSLLCQVLGFSQDLSQNGQQGETVKSCSAIPQYTVGVLPVISVHVLFT